MTKKTGNPTPGSNKNRDTLLNLSFKQIEIFNAVVVSGSISGAMVLTGLKQPTISQQIAKMEKLLGCLLFHRSRTDGIALTPAGEFWHSASTDLLSRRDAMLAHHQSHFSGDQLVLRFGTTPSLRGNFAQQVGRLAVSGGRFSRCEFVWGVNSVELVEMLETHKINCAVLSASTVKNHRSKLAVEPLYRDRIIWTVPRDLPDAMVAEALATGTMTHAAQAPLTRYVHVTPLVPWYEQTQDWFRTNLPSATPFFNCQTHETAVGFVAAGLATVHSPSSLIPNLPEQLLSKVKFYDLGRFGRDVVFAMPNHLQTLRAFSEFRAELCGYMRQRYVDESLGVEVLPLPGEAPTS